MSNRRVLGNGGGGLSYASGGTNNVIPKNNGAGAFVDSSLTDNGTVVTSTEQIAVPAGTLSAVGLRVGVTGQTGLYDRSGGNLTLATNGADRAELSTTGNANLRVLTGIALVPATSSVANGTILSNRSNGNLQLGAADVNGSPVAQTLSVQNAITGSNLSGSQFTIAAPLGTGNAVGAATKFQRAIMQASGTTAQTNADATAVGQSKTLSNTSATAQTFATIALGSNAGGGCSGICTIVATDGTNFDSETQSFNVSFVNKAGAVTVGTMAITASTAANNSGSATLGLTAVNNGGNIDIKVTPVFTTIVPTTVTLYPIITHCTNTVTFS